MDNKEFGIRKKQAAETRRKLYESAKTLFVKYDFDHVSVDSIVQAAGVSKGTFYVHFDSKDALLASFLSDYAAGMDLSYRTHLESLPSTVSASDAMLTFVGKIADALVDTICYDNIAAVYKLQLNRSVQMDAVKGYDRQLYRMFKDILARGMEKGEFSASLDLEELSRHFVMAIRGLTYEWCIRYPEFDLKTQTLVHYQMLLAGIKAGG